MGCMNYIGALNAFYERIQCIRVSGNGQLLYHTLLMVNNKSGWSEWFSRTNAGICGLMNVSEKAFMNAREELKQLGLIDFIPSRKRGECTKYRILYPTDYSTNDSTKEGTKGRTKEVQSTVQNTAQSTVQRTAQTTVQSADINKLKLKTKKSMSEDIPEKPPEPPKYGAGSFELSCVDRLSDSLRRQYPGAKTPETEAERGKWADEIGRMKRLDKRSEAEILEALEYAVADPFWQCNIRNTKKLREKCETLILQARGRKGRQGKAPPPNRFHNLESHGYDYDRMVWDMMGRKEAVDG